MFCEAAAAKQPGLAAVDAQAMWLWQHADLDFPGFSRGEAEKNAHSARVSVVGQGIRALSFAADRGGQPSRAPALAWTVVVHGSAIILKQ